MNFKARWFCAVLLIAPGLALGAISVTDAETLALPALTQERAALQVAHADGDADAGLALAILEFRLGNTNLAASLLQSMTGPRAAYYHGRILQQRGDLPGAKRLYTEAADQDDDLEAQALADAALFALVIEPALPNEVAAPPRRLPVGNYLLTSMKAGTVSGITDPADVGLVEATDRAVEMLIAGGLVLWEPAPTTLLRMTGALFREDYAEFSAWDVQVANLGVQLDRQFGSTLVTGSLGTTTTTLGGDDYLDQVALGLTATFPLSERWDLRVRGRLQEATAANPDYAWLEGDVTEFRAELRSRGAGAARLAWTVRDEDRADRYYGITTDSNLALTGFDSYSRVSYALDAEVGVDWHPNVRQRFLAGVRWSAYDDADRFLGAAADDTLSMGFRDSTRLRAGTELTWSLTPRLRATGSVDWFDESSDRAGYDYDSLRIGAGIEYTF